MHDISIYFMEYFLLGVLIFSVLAPPIAAIIILVLNLDERD